jgi:hypothetical protein
MSHEYEKKSKRKEKENIDHFNQLDLHCQSHIQSMDNKLNQWQQQQSQFKIQHEQKLNQLIKDKQNSVQLFLQNKNQNFTQIILHHKSIKNQIENLKINQNKEIELNKNSYQRNIELTHLSYRNKLKHIKDKFFHVSLFFITINQRCSWRRGRCLKNIDAATAGFSEDIHSMFVNATP